MPRTYTFQVTIADDLFNDGWTDQTLSAERVHTAICRAYPLARTAAIAVAALNDIETQREINRIRVARMVGLLAREGLIDDPGSHEAERYALALAEPVAQSASIYVRPDSGDE